ncbi:MAG: 5'-nucleotidase C-terminal domain-containing protein, partial [Spirochaetia bacterium]|nr:5'-nucleotidase C-terminal domain-containing protein [Spirochaetia bacterium]
ELLDSVDAEPDPKVTALIADIRKQHEEILNAQLGTMDFPLLAKNKDGSWIVRSKESNLADFVSDAFRTPLNADIGLVNGGGLRNNMAAGTICYKDALSVLPFGNIMCGAEVSGKTILDELEFGVRDLPANSGEFLHVSGLTYTLDTSIPSSTKTDASGLFSGVTGPYRISDVKVNGVPLDPEKKYLVAGLDFFLKNKGGGHNFADARFLPIENITDCEVLVEYVKKLGKVPAEYSDPAGQGRIKFKN